MIIGLSGYAGAGKDTAAAALAAYGYRRVAFADKLKDLAYRLDPPVGPGSWTLGETVDRYGWDAAKQHPMVRGFLQRLGVEVREVLGEDTWVREALPRDAGRADCLVITDVRFPNEADAVHAAGGYVVRIERPGIGPVNGHVSEQLTFDTDAFVVNDRTPQKLASRILDAVHTCQRWVSGGEAV